MASRLDELAKECVNLHRWVYYLKGKLESLGYEVTLDGEIPRITRKDHDDDDRE